MDGFLKSIDWRMRLGLAASLVGLASILLWLGLRSLVSGPWFVSVISVIMAAICMNVAGRSADAKLPDKLQDTLDRWKQARTRSTKSRQGRFVWNLGRSTVAAMAVWHFCNVAAQLSPQVQWILTGGFGVAFGFFGFEAALWSGLTVGLIAHGVAIVGLSVDFSDENSRAVFFDRWVSGAQKLSWMWLIGFAGVAPAWVGLAATVQKVKETIAEEVAQRRALAADKKRIDARRERLKAKAEAGGDDPLETAKKKLEEAQERARAFGRGTDAGAGETSNAERGNGSARELTGVEKLENANMAATLKRYAEQARANIESRRMGIDVNTEACRSFDRIILGMDDAHVAYLRADKEPLSKILLSYYDELCAVEDLATRAGDGEIVSSSYVSQEETASGSSGHPKGEGYGEMPAGYSDVPPGYEDDGMSGLNDLLDGGSAVQAGGRAAQAASGLSAMLASASVSEGADGAPVGGGNLPVNDDMSEEETGSMDGETVNQPSELGDGTGVTPDVGRDAHDGDQIKEIGVKDHVVIELEAQNKEKLEGDTPPPGQGENVASPIPEKPEAVGGLEHVPGSDSNQRDSVDDDDTRGSTDDKGDGSCRSALQVSAEELKNAAGVILSGQMDRDFIIQSCGWFDSQVAVALALGLPEALFAHSYQVYSEKVVGYRLELDLDAALQAEDPTVEAVGAAISALGETSWSADEDLVARAVKWVDETKEAARLRQEEALAAQAAQEKAQRVAQETAEREERERLARLEEDRIANEEAARIAREEAERVAQEEEKREAEAQRLSDLEAKRSKFAIKILAGQKDDELLDAAPVLFPSTTAFAEALELDESTVEGRYRDFMQVSEARQKYLELAAAFKAEDVNLVEALLEKPESFEGYSNPTFDLQAMQKWAAGVRERERLTGLIDDSVAVPDSGGASRRAFLIKRTRISKEVALMIDEELPKEMRLVQNLQNVIDLMPADESISMRAPLDLANARVRNLAAKVIEEKEGKCVAREYVQAFLPEDVKLPGMGAWETLCHLAQGGTAEEFRSAEQTGSNESGSSIPPAPEAASSLDQTPKRIKLDLPITHSVRKSIEEVRNLDAAEEIRMMKFDGRFDPENEGRKLRMSLQEIYTKHLEQFVVIDGHDIFAAVLDHLEQPVGRILIRIQSGDALAWYTEKHEAFTKNVTTGAVKSVAGDAIKQMFRTEIAAPNGDPDTVIGVAIMSPLISEEGVTSFEPIVDAFGGSATILMLSDGEALRRFVLSFHEMRQAA